MASNSSIHVDSVGMPLGGGAAVTLVGAEELLLPGVGSFWAAVTVAVLVIRPATAGILIVSVTVALLPLFNVPRLQETVVVPLQEP